LATVILKFAIHLTLFPSNYKIKNRHGKESILNFKTPGLATLVRQMEGVDFR